MKKKIILISLLTLITGYIIYSFSIVDFRFQKEEFLIKRNYNQNIQDFKSIQLFFKDLPSIAMNFDEDNKLDLQIQSNFLLEIDPNIVDSLYKIFGFQSLMIQTPL